MGFRLVPKSVIMNDLERRNDRYVAFFRRIRQLDGPITSKWLKIDYTVCDANVVQRIQFLAIYHLWRYSQRLPRTSALLIGTCTVYIHFSIMTRLKVSLCCRFDGNRPISTIWLQCKTLISILCSSRTVSLRQLSFLFLNENHGKRVYRSSLSDQQSSHCCCFQFISFCKCGNYS